MISSQGKSQLIKSSYIKKTWAHFLDVEEFIPRIKVSFFQTLQVTDINTLNLSLDVRSAKMKLKVSVKKNQWQGLYQL